MSGSFTQLSAEEFDWVMQVNFRAPVALLRALLPRLQETPGSDIVNTSSLWGIAAPANNAAYATSKFALRGLSEALRQDLARKSIGVTTVFPGGVATRILQEERPPASVPSASCAGSSGVTPGSCSPRAPSPSTSRRACSPPTTPE